MTERKPTVLLVEDNPVTLKMLRVWLEGEGFDVLDAMDGATAVDAASAHPPDLVIQDSVLPDINGRELAARLQAVAGGRVPTILLSGLASQSEALEKSRAFDLVLIKPVEPSRLVDAARTLLGTLRRRPQKTGAHILVVADTPANRKLTQFRLQLAGYRVTVVDSAEAALAKGRKRRPAAILADILMPGLDGFELCLAARRDPVLADVPIVLVSAGCRDEADRQIAKEAGAFDLVVRTPDLDDAVEAVRNALAAGPARPSDPRDFQPKHIDALRRQVERQIVQTQEVSERAAIQAAALSLMGALSQVLSNPGNVTGALGEVLVHCLDASGLSTGLLFLRDLEGRLRLHTAAGLSNTSRPAAQALFGHPELLEPGVRPEPIALAADQSDSTAARALLNTVQHRFALIVPFVLLGRHYGTLVLASDKHSLGTKAWQMFGQALAAQFGQVIALGEAMAEVASSEQLIRRALDASPNGLLMIDARGSIVLSNPTLERIFGYAESELVGQPVELLLPERLREAHIAHRAGFLTAPATRVMGAGRDLFGRHKDGRVVPVEIGLSPVTRGKEQFVLASVIDISERKRGEQAVVESAARVKALMDHANDAISVLSPEGVILEANQRLAALLECEPKTLVGRHIGEFLPPEALERIAEFGAAVAAGKGLIRSAKLRGDRGAIAFVDFSISTVTVGDHQLVLSIGRDVTEQRQLEQQFLQVQKMDALGRLAAGVAHDFNNILTTIMGYAELMGEDLPSSQRGDLDQIEKAALRAASLTQQLLAFSRQQILQPAVLDPNQQIADLEKMLRRLIGEDVALQLSLEPGIGNIKVDPGQLHQVVMNLVVNARDAMPTGGSISIETAPVTMAGGPVRGVRRDVPAGNYVVLRVRDTGIGMDEPTLPRIFEPFFTTKSLGKGTGLGLSTVFGIVEQSNGFIGVESTPGRGATFTIYFPLVQSPASAATPSTPADSRGSETILVTEDDHQLRALSCTMLERLGYTVLCAANGPDALELARVHADPIDLLLTDVVMPGSSGRELATELVKVRPDTSVLYMSGYTPDAIVQHGVLEEGIHLLHKPFTMGDLGRKVRQVLDGA